MSMTKHETTLQLAELMSVLEPGIEAFRIANELTHADIVALIKEALAIYKCKKP